MYLVADREGNIQEETGIQEKILRFLYKTKAGRCLLKPLVSPAVSKLGGWLLETHASAALIPAFVRRTGIDMSQYEERLYASYNDFFTRRLKRGMRSIEKDRGRLISPCDGRVSVYPVTQEGVFRIKHTPYTAASLLRNAKLAERFAGGYAWVFRLSVEDYHRYCFVDRGVVSRRLHIPGIFHTVQPIANDLEPIYKENTREYCLLQSENFGTILQMEVGALLVGKIENRPLAGPVFRGQEKGHFAFGGSTIVLMTEKGRVMPDADLLENSRKGIETKVRLGEGVGSQC